MIGRVIYDGGEVTLEDDGTVTATGVDADLRETLEIEARHYCEDYSPADGAFGRDLLDRWAEWFGGEVEVQPRDEDEGAVY